MQREVYSFIQNLVPIERGIPPRQPPCFQCTYDAARYIHSASALISYKDTVELVKKSLCFVGQSALKRCSRCDQANEQRCYDCPRELASLRNRLWEQLSRLDLKSTSTGADRTDVNHYPLSFLRIIAKDFIDHTRLFLMKHNLGDFNQLHSSLNVPVAKLVEWGCIDVSVTQQAEQQHQKLQQETEWDLSSPETLATEQTEQEQQQQQKKTHVEQDVSPSSSPSLEPYYSPSTFMGRGSSSKQRPQSQQDEVKKIHRTLEDIQSQLHMIAVHLSSMSSNHRREANARHEEIKTLLIHNRNGNSDDSEDTNNNESKNDKRRDGYNNVNDSSSSLSSSPPILGPSFLHPSSPISHNGEGSDSRHNFNPTPGGPIMLWPEFSPEQSLRVQAAFVAGRQHPESADGDRQTM